MPFVWFSDSIHVCLSKFWKANVSKIEFLRLKKLSLKLFDFLDLSAMFVFLNNREWGAKIKHRFESNLAWSKCHVYSVLISKSTLNQTFSRINDFFKESRAIIKEKKKNNRIGTDSQKYIYFFKQTNK